MQADLPHHHPRQMGNLGSGPSSSQNLGPFQGDSPFETKITFWETEVLFRNASEKAVEGDPLFPRPLEKGSALGNISQ